MAGMGCETDQVCPPNTHHLAERSRTALKEVGINEKNPKLSSAVASLVWDRGRD